MKYAVDSDICAYLRLIQPRYDGVLGEIQE